MPLLELPHFTDQDLSLNRETGQDKVGPKGTLIMIGGRAEEATLQVVADHLSSPKHLAITAIASGYPHEQYTYYREQFNGLDVTTNHLNIKENELPDEYYIRPNTSGIFFTGGKQDVLMNKLKQTLFKHELKEYHERGGTIIGTSAGASFMGDIMPLVDSHEQGFGLVPHIIDQHIRRPRREGRLARLVTQFPDRIGIGIDENTAVIYQDLVMKVMGEGQVYVLAKNGGRSLDEVVLNEGDIFDLSSLNSYAEVAAGD